MPTQINGNNGVNRVQDNTVEFSDLNPSADYSMVRLNTANGYGSTNTRIRRFTNVVANVGADITYADSATLGGSFTINKSGVYSISYNDQFSASGSLGISLNSNQLTIAINLINASNFLAGQTVGAANHLGCATWQGYLQAGDIIRPHTDASISGTNVNSCQFTIARVA